MNEEVLNEVVEQPLLNTPEVIAEESKDPYVELAQEYGWNPEKGDKSAKDFIKYAMENLEPRGKELKELKQTLSKVAEYVEEQKKVSYQQAMKDFEARKTEAFQSGDMQALDKVYEEQRQYAAPKPTDDLVADFKARYHTLYSDRSSEGFKIRKFIKDRDADLAEFGLPPSEHLAIVEQDLLKAYPEYFGLTTAKPSVEKGSNTSSTTGQRKTFGYNDLTKEEKEIADFLKMQGMSIDAYIKGLAGTRK